VRLLERDHPLDVLIERARRAADGHGGLVLVAGEAGIGKTVLLRTFAASIRATAQPLWGLCDPLTTPRPLGPLRDVAAELDAGVSALLAEGAPQHDIFAAVLDALRGRARVLIVEDLHWADQATLDLVRYLARRVHGLPLLLVLSYRDSVGAEHPLRPVLGDLVSSPDARRLQLVPLSRTAVAELLSDHPLDPDDVHRRTAGNPFFVSQILAQPESPLPESVRDAVIARTAALPAPARRGLELLSCAPEGVSGELLAALKVPVGLVETLTDTGLVDRRGPGLAFRHEIARTAVLQATPPGVEAALHLTMIEALERIGGEASVLVHHADAAGDVPRILRYTPAAAVEAAGSGAHREALACYELALRHVGEDRAARAALFEGMSEQLYVSDRLAEAIEVRTRALELHRELGDHLAVGVAHRALSALAWYAADRGAAEHHDRESVGILQDAGDHRELGYSLANRAYLAAQRGAATEAVRDGGLARDIADELDDDLLWATAAVPVAVTRLLEGHLEARADLLDAADTGGAGTWARVQAPG
jgi:tetratricopeptide (TPR) repeat protein